MKHKFTLLKLVFFALFSILTATAFAQVQPTPPGASDPNAAPPTSPPTASTSYAKILCSTDNISLKSGQGANPAYKYQWYKTNTSGTKVLVKETVGDDTYTEPASGPGYYKYELIVLNGNDCPSPPTDITLYVLPVLNPVINGGAVVCAQNKTSTDLTITGLPAGFQYTYQWTRSVNGGTPTDIAAPAGTANHYLVEEANAGTVTYGVIVKYQLNGNCQGTASKSITVDALPAAPTIVIN